MATPPESPEPAKSSPSPMVGLQMYSGPLPPPDALAAYERAHPGAAGRIIAMAEVDQKAEISTVKFEQRARLIIDIIGQLFLYALVGAAVLLALSDKPLEAFFAGLAPIAVTIFANLRKRSEPPHDEDD